MLESKKDRILVVSIVGVVALVVLVTLATPAILAGSEDSPGFSLSNASTLEDYVIQAMLYATEYGSDVALSEFNNPNGPFASSNYYIIAYDSNGTLLAMSENPALVGQNQIDVRDVYGVQSVMQCLIRAGHGGGYVYAISPEWFRGTEQATSGTTVNLLYILPVDSTWFVFSGDDPQGVSAEMSLAAKDRLDAYVEKAVSYVDANGVDAAVAAFNDPSGQFAEEGLTLMVFDEDGILSTYQDDASLIGADIRGIIDSHKTSVGRDVYQMGHKGGGYLYDALQAADGSEHMKFISVVPIADGLYLAGSVNIGIVA